ncbi:hypothetical protein DD564_14340 [Vibrio cholerae O1 biovar El Tor]|nr:hypothetical protein [Vibrio cholerae]PVX19511.1 hypothetical protein DD564_14340 [Vibrio cholerae O1 biovar El Tor]QLK91604.1 hypothetical protein FDZ90_14875 [Vibrio cholerae]HAS7879455.1 hypothetical protein [Vibrio cholerae]
MYKVLNLANLSHKSNKERIKKRLNPETISTNRLICKKITYIIGLTIFKKLKKSQYGWYLLL